MSIQPLLPLWMIATGLLMLFALTAWLEIRNPIRRREARLTALLLAFLAIAALLLRPAIEQVISEKPILLLTKDYDRQQLDSILTKPSGRQVYYLPDAAPYRGGTLLAELTDLSILGRRVQAIAGEGLPAYALEYFPKKNFRYFPSDPVPGISNIQQKKYQKQQPNQLEGRYFMGESPVKLVLKSPAAEEDSVLLSGSGEQAFSLQFTPKNEGKWQYELLTKDSTGNILDQQSLPLQVEAEKQLRILILQAYPTFEIRYLKDFLAARGHAPAIRSQVSRNKYRTEFVNQSAIRLDRLDAGVLAQFDLLLADGAAYDLLSANEQSALETAIREGLGFLALVDHEGPAFRQRLGLTDITDTPDTVRLAAGLTLPVYSVVPSSDREWYPVHAGKPNRPAAAYHYQGKGRVAYQSATESYPYLLRGDSLAYARLWMPLLEKTARPEYQSFTLDLLHDFPVFAGEPVDFRVIAAQELGPVYADSLRVPMQEDHRLAGIWYGRSWPREAGWHSVQTGETTLAYYAFPAGSLPTLRPAQQRKSTLAMAQPDTDAIIQDYKHTVAKPISRLWFYLLFLLSAGFLWLVPKL